MQQGLVISATLHLALILLAVLGLPERRAESAARPVEMSAAVMSRVAFDAMRSAAPTVPDALETELSAPSEGGVEAPEVSADVAPDAVPSAAPDAPDADAAPNLAALLPVTPEVATDVAAPVADLDTGTLGADTLLPDAPAQDGGLTGETRALLAPPRAAEAPRIDTSAAPKPPERAAPAPENVPATAETGPEPAEEETAAEAPPEAAPPPEPEAEPDAPETQPRIATRPRGRPVNLQAEAEARAEAEEAARQQAAAEAEAAAIAAAVAEAAAARPEPVPAPALGADFNSADRRAIGDAIGDRWNLGSLRGKANYETLVVTVRVQLRADGSVMGEVEPVDPATPTGDYKFAYELARRAIKIAASRGGIPVPQDKFRDGDYLEIRFIPDRGVVLN